MSNEDAILNELIHKFASQGLFLLSVEFNKSANGRADLEFKFAKNSLTHQQVSQILTQEMQGSMGIISTRFGDDSKDSACSRVSLVCSFDFTQELDADEIENVAAAKGKKPAPSLSQIVQDKENKGIKPVGVGHTNLLGGGKAYYVDWADGTTTNFRSTNPFTIYTKPYYNKWGDLVTKDDL